MIVQGIIAIVLFLLAGLTESAKEILMYKYEESVFSKLKASFWNHKESWRNKWKNGDPKQGEKFFGSSRWFVGLTDGDHLLDTIKWTFLTLAVSILMPTFWSVLGTFAVLRFIAYPTVFHFGFHKIFSKNG